MNYARSVLWIILPMCAQATAGCNGLFHGRDRPEDIPADLRLDDASGNRMEWNRNAGQVSYRLTYTSGFGEPRGTTTKRQTVSLSLERPHWVEVSGDSIISTTYRYHPWRLAVPTSDDSVVQPAIGLLELAPFTKPLAVGAEDRDVTKPTNDVLNFQSQRTTRIEAITGNTVSYKTILAYRIPVTRGSSDLARELWREETEDVLSRLEWLTKDWTPYGICDARYDRSRGLLVTKRCVFHHLPDRGASVDSVRNHPKRMEVLIERVGA